MSSPDAAISIGYYRGPLERVLIGLAQAPLEGAVLRLDGESSELAEFVDARASRHPELAEANKLARGWTFGPVTFSEGDWHLPIEGDNVERVHAMMEHHADPEIAICLYVEDAHGELVAAPDVGDNEIWVSERLPQAALDAIRRALGTGLTPVETEPGT